MEFKLSKCVNILVVIAAVFAVTVNCGTINEADYDDSEMSSVYGVKVYAPTSICSKSGGMCVHRDDCAKGQFALKSGMCGYNDKNVECCFEVVKREASCRQFGGQCMDFCAPTIRESLGNDCGNRTCCILV